VSVLAKLEHYRDRRLEAVYWPDGKPDKREGSEAVAGTITLIWRVVTFSAEIVQGGNYGELFLTAEGGTPVTRSEVRKFVKTTGLKLGDELMVKAGSGLRCWELVLPKSGEQR
jgi:hypothetical protein